MAIQGEFRGTERYRYSACSCDTRVIFTSNTTMGPGIPQDGGQFAVNGTFINNAVLNSTTVPRRRDNLYDITRKPTPYRWQLLDGDAFTGRDGAMSGVDEPAFNYDFIGVGDGENIFDRPHTLNSSTNPKLKMMISNFSQGDVVDFVMFNAIAGAASYVDHVEIRLIGGDAMADCFNGDTSIGGPTGPVMFRDLVPTDGALIFEFTAITSGDVVAFGGFDFMVKQR